MTPDRAPDRTWDPIRFRRGTRGSPPSSPPSTASSSSASALFAAPTAGPARAALVVGRRPDRGRRHRPPGRRGRTRPGAPVGRPLDRVPGGGRDRRLGVRDPAHPRAELDIFGAAGATTAAFFAFMIGWLLIGMRFALQAFAPDQPRSRRRAGRAGRDQARDGRQYVIRPMAQATFA